MANLDKGTNGSEEDQKKIRLQIDLEEEEVFLLTKMSERLGISIDEIINIALRKYEQDLRNNSKGNK
ncbi:hypothetical protein [Prochlorococcus marinus]|uniref:hypothetical protein n=1 Tax=Prochlorococcus marinus TaxID=1219 RepID=UPI0022B42664|nr:hypothetical protein [Prochlorococcus marinus]